MFAESPVAAPEAVPVITLPLFVLLSFVSLLPFEEDSLSLPELLLLPVPELPVFPAPVLLLLFPLSVVKFQISSSSGFNAHFSIAYATPSSELERVS